MSHKTAWSVSGDLQSNNASKAVQLQAEFHEIGNYLVQFGISKTPGDSINPQAELTWSVEGNSVRRVITVVNGVSVTGSAQAVKVKMYDAGSQVAGARDYTGSIQVVPGVRPSQNQPPTLFGAVGTLVDSAAVTVPLPVDSGIISVLIKVASDDVTAAHPIPAGSVYAIQQDSAGARISVYEPQDYDYVTISRDVTSVSIKNVSGLTIRYSMTFGIDG